MTDPREPSAPSNRVLDRFRRNLARGRRRRLGELAVERGWATARQVDEALAEQGGGEVPDRRMGEILVARGILTPERLSELLDAQGREILDSFAAPATVAVPSEVANHASDPKRVYGQYVLVERVGQGGMADVWKAWDRGLDRWVAVKVHRPEGHDHSGRFFREAKLEAKLDHTNIVRVFATGGKDGIPYIVMEYVDGAAVGPGRMASGEAARIVRDAAVAVHHAHQHGIIHRDLKPANLLLGRDGRLRVTDFGLARQVSASPRATIPGTVLGTPAYMSPEQAEGGIDRVTAASDIFSLGATLYELTTGRPPYQGVNSNEILVQAMRCRATAPRLVDPEIPPGLEAVIRRAMHREPERRYLSAKDMADDLTRHLAGRRTMAEGGAVRRVAVIAFLLVAAFLAWFLVQTPPPPPETSTVDLLPLIVPARDQVLGTWAFEGKALVNTVPTPFGRILIPYHPPSEYDLEAVIERTRGRDLIQFGIVVDGIQAGVIIDGYPLWGGRSGVQMVNGRPAPLNRTAHAGYLLKNDVRTRIRIRVRPRRVELEIAGKTVVVWEGDSGELANPILTAVPDAKALYLVGSNSRFVIHELKLRKIESKGPPKAP